MNEQVNITELLSIVMRRWWILLLSVCICGLGAYVYTEFFIAEQFTSRGMLYVNNARDRQSTSVNIADLNTSKMLVETYIEILQSDTFLTYVGEELEGYTASQLRGCLKMSAKNETELLEISATTGDAMLSHEIVNCILRSAGTEIERIVRGGSVVIVDNASFNPAPTYPSAKKNTAIGVLLGALLGFAIIFLLNFFDNRVKVTDDLSESYGIPVLGMIPGLLETK